MTDYIYNYIIGVSREMSGPAGIYAVVGIITFSLAWFRRLISTGLTITLFIYLIMTTALIRWLFH